MKLFIDDRPADTDERTSFSISLSIGTVTEPEYSRTGFSKSISIPMTSRNRSIMGGCEEVHGRDRFNAESHTARIEHEGCTVMDGTIVLTKCVVEAGGGSYIFNIVGHGAAWARYCSARGLSSLFPDWETVINARSISESWTDDSPVKFFPVARDSYGLRNSSTGILPPDRILTASDYHPFINIRKAVYEIFREAGYSVCSEFVSTDFFGSLYMSGNYPSRDVTALKARMDFLAERFSPAEAVADHDGRIYADPYALHNTIGNIVDGADPQDPAAGKNTGIFTNNDCFAKTDERVAFIPLHEVSAGFEYRFKYVTGYRIKNGLELEGFDRIYLGNDDMREFRLSNLFKDRKGEFRSGKSFLCVVPNHAEGNYYTLEAWNVPDPDADPARLEPSEYTNVNIADFTSRSAVVSTLVEGNYTNLRLYCRKPGDTRFALWTGEWLLYDGYITEEGRTEIEITVRSKAERLTPSSPKYFDDIYFGGAWHGTYFKLMEASVRPVFLLHPTEGSKVDFAQVCAHGVSRMELLRALRQMFNLCFYTDNLGKEVYIEPRSGFYNSQTVDWTSRIAAGSYELEELSASAPGSIDFRYRSGDAAVASLNAASSTGFAQWTADTGNPQALVKVMENPLFTPSLNSAGYLPSARSASLVIAGDRDANGEYRSDDLNFLPKIVCYAGMKTLPDGESWGWPFYGTRYPLIFFHPSEPGSDESQYGSLHNGELSGVTLCFEDRDGCRGLNRFWMQNIGMYRDGMRMKLRLRLQPQDIEPFLQPDILLRDFRALYMFHINGERTMWRLEEITDYSPRGKTALCSFVKELPAVSNAGQAK